MSQEAKEPSQWAKDLLDEIMGICDFSCRTSKYNASARAIDAYINQCDQKLTMAYDGFCREQDQRIDQLTLLLDEAVKTLSLYVNVPEATRIKEAWEKIKVDDQKPQA